MRTKLYFKEYGATSWDDWTEYLVESPQLPQGVESDEEGEAGLITYDVVNVILYNDPGNPVYAAFETNWTSSKKYLFRIDKADNLGNFSTKHIGLADFGTIDFPDLSKKVSFDIKDRLSSLEVLESGAGREEVNIYERSGAQAYLDAGDWTGSNGYIVKGSWTTNYKSFYMYIEYFPAGLGSTENYQPPISTVLPGEIFPFDDKYYLVKSRQLTTINPGQNERDVLEIEVVAAEEPEVTQKVFHDEYNIYGKDYYGVDINIVTNNVLQKFDGFKIIQALVNNTWADITVINQTGAVIYDIALQLYNDIIFNNPFDYEPPDAIRYLADSINSYVYIDEQDQLIISERSELGTIGTLRSLGSTQIIDGSRQPIWDKLADAVEVTVKSGIVVNGEVLTGFAEVRKNPNIRPRNPIRKEILLTDNTVNDQASLDAYAASIAQLYLNFYGYRHIGYKLELALDSNTIEWKLLDRIQIDSIIYFIVNLTYTPDNNIHLELVSIPTYDYDPKSVLMPKKEERSNVVTYATASGNTYTTGNPYLWDGGPTGLNPVLARTSIGIDVTEPLTYDINTGLIGLAYSNKFTVNESGELDLIAGVYTFNAPLNETDSAVDLLYNSTNLQVNGSNQLDTIQPIHLTSTPQFARLGLGKAADASLSLDTLAGGNIGGDLTVQGNLTVLGTNFIADVQTVQIEDNLLLINKNETGGGVTAGVAGIEVERGTLTNYQFLFNETSDTFRIGEVGSLQAVATRQDTPIAGGFTYFNDTAFRLDTLSGFKYNGSQLILDYNIGTSNYVSQLTGWEITSSGNADFRYIYADELHVKAFIADISQALAGSDFLTKSVAKLSRDFTVPNTGNTGYIYLEDLPGFEDTQVFESGDWIRLRVIDRSGGGLIVSDAWGTVTNYVNLSNGEQRWTFTTQDAGVVNGLQVYTGSIVLDYGTSGDGFIERTVLDAAGSPYDRIVYWTTNPSNPSNYNLVYQHGSLDGINDPDFGSLSGIGVYAVDNIYIKGVIKALAGGEIANFDIYGDRLSTTNAYLIGGNTPQFKIWQNATTDYVGMWYSNSSSWGIAGKKNDLVYFQLGSGNQIAGANFDWEKMYSGDVRLEWSASLKGLAVKKNIGGLDLDLIKIGDHSSTPPDAPVDLSSTLLPEGDFNTSTDYNAWTKTDSNEFTYYSGGYSGYCLKSDAFLNVSNYEETASITKSIASEYRGITVELTWRYKHLTEFAGEFRDFDLTIEDNNNNVLFAQTYSTSNTLWTSKTIKFVIPSSATSVTYKWKFFKVGTSQTASSLLIDEMKLEVYNNTFSYINKDGFNFYSSALNYLSFLKGVLKLNAYEVLIKGVPPARYQGWYPSGTSAAEIENLSNGDFYEIDNKLYMQTANGSALLWTAPIS